GSGNIENVFSSYFVSGQQGSTAQDNFLNTLMIEGVDLLYPGLATEGTAIQWNIDLQHPIPISGSDYEDIAHSLHMGH
ncbi:MAG: hypothetical protein VX543_02795, partial [Cyanobacteriota bacterium]|nr:hypothetical protein [Cyanobacteriota bacterium]